MFRKTLAVTLAIVMVFTLVGGISVFADSTNNKLGSIENQIDKKQDKIDENNEKRQELKNKISSLEDSIKNTERDLAELRKEISSINKKTDKINSKIEKLKKKIDEQQQVLDSRLRSMYKNGNMGVIQVLLGSVDIQDFMSNFKLINELHKSDVQILEGLEADRNTVAKQKAELDALAQKVKSHEASQVEKQKQLQDDKTEIAAAKAKIEAENQELHKDIDALEAESARLSAEIAGYDDSGIEYTGNGQFTWPFPGYSRMSSPFGYRIHPVTGARKFHSGVDLAGPYGSKIVAAEDGVVMTAGWNGGGYGNYVIISHGGGISTLYGHNSSLAVSSGQKVKRGQTIARCGSTGLSTGNHLHFEVRVKGSPVNPLNYI